MVRASVEHLFLSQITREEGDAAFMGKTHAPVELQDSIEPDNHEFQRQNELHDEQSVWPIDESVHETGQEVLPVLAIVVWVQDRGVDDAFQGQAVGLLGGDERFFMARDTVQHAQMKSQAHGTVEKGGQTRP